MHKEAPLIALAELLSRSGALLMESQPAGLGAVEDTSTKVYRAER